MLSLRSIRRTRRSCLDALFFLFVVVFIVGCYNLYELWTIARVTNDGSIVAVPEATNSVTTALNTTECFPSEFELVDFPNCHSKWEWMKEGWMTDVCYAKMGVNGTGCSIRQFLSTHESHCPPLPGAPPIDESMIAKPNFSMEDLFAKMTGKPVDFEFIKKRISGMWDSWKAAYAENVKTHAKSMENRPRLRIILHLGLLVWTDYAKQSSKGGPLGDLVQWADLIASLHILGHDIHISSEIATVTRYLDVLGRNSSACGRGNRIDLIFTDIMGLKQKTFDEKLRCKLRLLDAFGTQAEFNSQQYYAAHKSELGGKGNPWGGHGLALRQFLTFYPHTPDNTYLGFVVNTHHNATETSVNRSGVLVYGKDKYNGEWARAEEAIKTAMNITEVHATVPAAMAVSILPKGVINHELLKEADFHRLLSKVRVFLGIGVPLEANAALEAVAHGTIFINPRFSPPKGRLTMKEGEADLQKLVDKPTLRSLTSQCPYLEAMGEPWVITVDTQNMTALREALQKAMKTEVKPRLPSELTAAGMLLRVSLIVDRLDTCEPLPKWPPPSALRQKIGKDGASCEATCAEAELRCDSALFPLVNKKEKLMETMGCKEIGRAASIVAPSRCTLQENALLYSCSSSVAGTVRLCPCRDFLPDQRELCTKCL